MFIPRTILKTKKTDKPTMKNTKNASQLIGIQRA